MSARSRRSSVAEPEEGEETTEESSDEESADEESTEETEAPSDAPADFATDGPALMDVDVADIGDERLEGEAEPLIQAGEVWVKLGQTDEVPEWAQGNFAQVISAPVITVTDEETGNSSQVNPPNATYEVRERGQGPTFFVSRDAFKKVYLHGRPDKAA